MRISPLAVALLLYASGVAAQTKYPTYTVETAPAGACNCAYKARHEVLAGGSFACLADTLNPPNCIWTQVSSGGGSGGSPPAGVIREIQVKSGPSSFGASGFCSFSSGTVRGLDYDCDGTAEWKQDNSTGAQSFDPNDDASIDYTFGGFSVGGSWTFSLSAAFSEGFTVPLGFSPSFGGGLQIGANQAATFNRSSGSFSIGTSGNAWMFTRSSAVGSMQFGSQTLTIPTVWWGKSYPQSGIGLQNTGACAGEAGAGTFCTGSAPSSSTYDLQWCNDVGNCSWITRGSAVVADQINTARNGNPNLFCDGTSCKFDTNQDGTTDAVISPPAVAGELKLAGDDAVILDADADSDATARVDLKTGATTWRFQTRTCSVGQDLEVASVASGVVSVTCGPDGSGGGSGDMTKAVYDTNNDSTVDKAAALAADGSNCSAGQAAQGVDDAGNAQGCFTPSGGGGSPGGVGGQVQYNNAGAFAGMSGLAWTDGTSTLVCQDGTEIDLSPNPLNATNKGLILPQGTTSASMTREGQIGWESGRNGLLVGNGDAAQLVGGAIYRWVSYSNDCLTPIRSISNVVTNYSGQNPSPPDRVCGKVESSNNNSDAATQGFNTTIGEWDLTSGWDNTITAGEDGIIGIAFTRQVTSTGASPPTAAGSINLIPTKMREWVARFRAGTTGRYFTGGIITGTDSDLTTKKSGIYFWCDPTADVNDDGAAGTGTDKNWWGVTDNNITADAVCMVDGTGACTKPTARTAVDTGLDCTRTGYHTLRVTYDGTSLKFYADDDGDETTWTFTSSAVTTNIPTNAIWGWVLWAEAPTTANTATMRIDYYSYTGVR